MGRYVCFLEGKFFIYSEIVDAPISHPMTEEGLRSWVRCFESPAALDGLTPRIERARSNGTDGPALRRQGAPRYTAVPRPGVRHAA